jgi:hypothetical protein
MGDKSKGVARQKNVQKNLFLILVVAVNGDRNVAAGDLALVESLLHVVAVVPSALLPTLQLLACLLR